VEGRRKRSKILKNNKSIFTQKGDVELRDEADRHMEEEIKKIKRVKGVKITSPSGPDEK
jgi:hypothetical protein